MKLLPLIQSLPILAIGLFGPNSPEIPPGKFPARSSNYQPLQIGSNQQQEPVFTTKTYFMKKTIEGCYTMQLNIYATYPNGQVYLKHTAVFRSGNKCTETDKVLNNNTFSKKSGPEYIVKDEQINGPIEDFIAGHEALYQIFVLDKEEIMRKR